MKKHLKAHALFVFWAVQMLAPVGCLHGGSVNPESEIHAEIIHQGTFCHTAQPEPHLRWIFSRQAFEAVWEKQFSHLLGGPVPEPPDVDFDHYGVLMVHMGVQNTGGYSVGLADSTIKVKNQVAMVMVHWVSPPTDGMVAQVVTQPCLTVKLKKGDFNRIEVFDDSGNVRLSTDTTAS